MGNVGKRVTMNSTLIKTKNKQYDLKFHATRTGFGYLFMKSAEDQALLKCSENKTCARLAGQSFITSTGILAPIDLIPNVVEIELTKFSSYDLFDRSWSTSQKGAWAMELLVQFMTEQNESPIVVTNRIRQLLGQDVYLKKTKLYVQSKCDAKGGRWPSGSGNLYLETSEINMRGDH